ncbi:unnamed protein product [Callosobruchus maculatus]|uniref:Uncharacterized protein n=1 Tax=Callosobruchus maculatus TaxID=64391 RepID=A0A653DND9_CALMS|nr:unnamed protein product [Callosobruchus maculatus]
MFLNILRWRIRFRSLRTLFPDTLYDFTCNFRHDFVMSLCNRSSLSTFFSNIKFHDKMPSLKYPFVIELEYNMSEVRLVFYKERNLSSAYL